MAGESSVVTLRAATEGDADQLSRIYAPFVTDTAVSFEESAPDAADFVRRMHGEPRLPWLVAEVSREVAGYAYASPHRHRPAYRWSVDCSVYLDPRYLRRGLGRRLYSRLFDLLGELGYVSVFAGIALPNPPSTGLHESLGFEHVGVYRDVGYKSGQWRDVGWWQKQLRQPGAMPAEPVSWDPESFEP